jgi:hypothetical protein
MVTTTAFYTQSRYRAATGEGLDGVVRVNFGVSYASGALLFDGRAVLTAAHLFGGRSGTASVNFETSSGIQTLHSTRILQHPGYDTQSNSDLAIVWLGSAAPILANRYELHRQSDEIGQTFTLSGYGQAGTGTTGSLGVNSPWRLKAQNQFDADAALLKYYMGAGMSWSPLPGTQLLADFDDGSSARDASGRLIARPGLGLGDDEGMIAQGDSGGPAFIQGRLAGVASYMAALGLGSTKPDIDQQVNSSFGELGAWQRVSAFQQWIDQSLRAQYPNAPTQASEVKKQVTEGHSGTSYVYFMIQFKGMRSHPQEWVSVDFATRNGTALAGSDYIAASGRLNLYPGENQALIPVEIIGDTVPEPSEYFYLDVFNPVGGRFENGAVKLTAMRTILDDDGWFA